MNEQAITQLAGRSVVARRSPLNIFQEFVPISGHSFCISTKFMARKFPEFFLLKFSGKAWLFFRKFPEKFRRKFPEVSQVATLL